MSTAHLSQMRVSLSSIRESSRSDFSTALDIVPYPVHYYTIYWIQYPIQCTRCLQRLLDKIHCYLLNQQEQIIRSQKWNILGNLISFSCWLLSWSYRPRSEHGKHKLKCSDIENWLSYSGNQAESSGFQNFWVLSPNFGIPSLTMRKLWQSDWSSRHSLCRELGSINEDIEN